jgi:hypothetical protein
MTISTLPYSDEIDFCLSKRDLCIECATPGALTTLKSKESAHINRSGMNERENFLLPWKQQAMIIEIKK